MRREGGREGGGWTRRDGYGYVDGDGAGAGNGLVGKGEMMMLAGISCNACDVDGGDGLGGD